MFSFSKSKYRTLLKFPFFRRGGRAADGVVTVGFSLLDYKPAKQHLTVTTPSGKPATPSKKGNENDFIFDKHLPAARYSSFKRRRYFLIKLLEGCSFGILFVSLLCNRFYCACRFSYCSTRKIRCAYFTYRS